MTSASLTAEMIILSDRLAEAVRERDEARLALLAQAARETLTCGWCGDMMQAPPGFTPPMTTEKIQQTVKLHMLDCPKHPIRETERELKETREERDRLRAFVESLTDANGPHTDINGSSVIPAAYDILRSLQNVQEHTTPRNEA